MVVISVEFYLRQEGLSRFLSKQAQMQMHRLIRSHLPKQIRSKQL